MKCDYCKKNFNKGYKAEGITQTYNICRRCYKLGRKQMLESCNKCKSKCGMKDSKYPINDKCRSVNFIKLYTKSGTMEMKCWESEEE